MKYKAWTALDPITTASEIISIAAWPYDPAKRRIVLTDGRAINLEQNFAEPAVGDYWATFESGLERLYSKQKFHQTFAEVIDIPQSKS